MSGLLTITKPDLDSSSTIKFYFARTDYPETMDDLSELGALANYSKVYRNYFEPGFIR